MNNVIVWKITAGILMHLLARKPWIRSSNAIPPLSPTKPQPQLSQPPSTQNPSKTNRNDPPTHTTKVSHKHTLTNTCTADIVYLITAHLTQIPYKNTRGRNKLLFIVVLNIYFTLRKTKNTSLFKICVLFHRNSKLFSCRRLRMFLKFKQGWHLF